MVPEGYKIVPCKQHPANCWLMICDRNPNLVEHHVSMESALHSAQRHSASRNPATTPNGTRLSAPVE